MSDFTPEEQAKFAIQFLFDAAKQDSIQIGALKSLLVKKGLATLDEIREAMRDVDMNLTIRAMLDPEIQAPLDEVREFLGGRESD